MDQGNRKAQAELLKQLLDQIVEKSVGTDIYSTLLAQISEHPFVRAVKVLPVGVATPDLAVGGTLILAKDASGKIIEYFTAPVFKENA